jgi:sortase A
MTMYAYIKAPPGHRLKKPASKLAYLRVFLSVFLLTHGIASFTSVAYPLISYQLIYAPRLKQSDRLLSPIAPSLELPLNVTTAKASEPQVLPELIGTPLDLTDSEFWYPTQSVQQQDASRLIYNLTIPKLKINGAVVRNDNTDLKESLIHYPTTASPGDLGNAVIFGHSVLPQYFDPTSYTTIFSTLHTLKNGDEITLFDGQASFRYIIQEMYETAPDDLSPLAQRYDNRYLTLITCTPPGTYLRRLIIKAVLL